MHRGAHFPPGLEPPIAVRAPDGSCAWITPHGAQVLSWVPAGGAEQLYLSPRTPTAPGQAIRGGVPLVFPQFSLRGPLPRHGFARNLRWELEGQAEGSDHALALWRLRASAATRQHWPAEFLLEFALRVEPGRLSLRLDCRNAGTAPFGFQAALHTYLRVHDVGAVALDGLGGCRYWDTRPDAPRPEDEQPAGLLDIPTAIDRIYLSVPGPVQLVEGGRARLRVEQQGFEDVVVWNPGAAGCAAMADMPPEGWRAMLCVEAARIAQPVALAPGAQWSGVQTLQVL